MTTEQQAIKDIYDQKLKEKKLRFLILGYTIGQNNEMEYHSIACEGEESRDRNLKILVGAVVWELDDKNKKMVL